MAAPIPIGIDNFRILRETGLSYVDKSDMIRQLLDRPGVQVTLLPRPRRFGKTLNLTMLRAWFEKCDEDLHHLFQDLSIWQAGDAYRAHFQRYPVIYFNFKRSRAETFAGCWDILREKIIDLFKVHRQVLDEGHLDEVDARRYRQILDGTASEALYQRALLDLSAHLHAFHGEQVVILIDEYDEPIHTGHVNGYAPKILDFSAHDRCRRARGPRDGPPMARCAGGRQGAPVRRHRWLEAPTRDPIRHRSRSSTAAQRWPAS